MSLNGQQHLHITFPASLNEVDAVLTQTMAFLKKNSLSDDLFIYNYIIREGLNNAVLHGSKEDRTKTVLFDLSLSKEALDICIEDEGDGFDWPPLLTRNLVSPDENHGRGIFCMSEFKFEIKYNTKGNILYLHKDLKNQPNKTEPNHESH